MASRKEKKAAVQQSRSPYSSNPRQQRGASANQRGASGSQRYSRTSANYGSGNAEADQRHAAEVKSGHVASQEKIDEFLSQYQRGSSNYSHKAAKKQSGRGKKVLIGILIALLVILIGGGVAAGLYIKKLNDSFDGNISEEEKLAIQEKLKTNTSLNEPFYMLLLGSDARKNNADMGERADVTVLARIDAPNAKITLMSIPRDTQIVYKYSTMKFNAAFAYDGIGGAIDAASELTGVQISHYAKVDFDALEELVDAVGGVDVDVPERIEDRKAGKSVIEAGMQHLDGKAALTFARSRQYADGDFTRTSNQRLLIKAIADKVMKTPATSLPGVVQSAASSVTTDLSLTDIYSLAIMFKKADKMTLYSAMVPSTTGMSGNISYVFCDQEGLANMMAAVEAGEDPSKIETAGASHSSLYNDDGSLVSEVGQQDGSDGQ